jgi:hypothetical protein
MPKIRDEEYGWDEEQELSRLDLEDMREQERLLSDDELDDAPRWVDRHSVDCSGCDALIDERDCVRGPDEDEPYFCKACANTRGLPDEEDEREADD